MILAHGLALLGVGERGVERRPRHTDGAGGDVDTTDLEHAEDLGQAASRLPDQVGGGDAVVGVGHLDGLDAAVAQLADVLAHRDPLELRSRLLLDDEGGDALLGACRQGDDGGALPVGDPGLGAVDDVLVAVPPGAARDVARVAAGVGLREGEGAAAFPAGHVRQPAALLLLVAVGEDQGGGHGVGVHDAGQAHPAVGELLDHADVGQEVEPEPSVRLGDGDAEEAEVAHLLDDPGGEGVGPLELGGDGDDLASDERADRPDDLGPDRFVRSGRLRHLRSRRAARPRRPGRAAPEEACSRR